MRRLVGRRLLGVLVAAGSCRAVHERPFREKSREERDDDAVDVAKEALLQFNLMVERGVEPDALTYTSLIATMGRAKWEWQAYKLFSRMLAQQVTPLPETYVALRDATNPKRARLMRDLDARIEETMETLPNQVAQEDARQRSDADRRCVERFEEYMKGELPEVSRDARHGATEKSPPADAANASGEYTTMHIHSPENVWASMKAMHEVQSATGAVAAGEERGRLLQQLQGLHEEELRIFLAIHRQLRHGPKDDLVLRVIDTCSVSSIEGMLARRKKYFRNVAGLLKRDLDEISDKQASVPAATATGDDATDELSADEQFRQEPTSLLTPWGVLLKPLKKPQADFVATPRMREAQEKLLQMPLTGEEVDLVVRKAAIGELDELPGALLRRYAHQYKLRWKRRFPQSLLEGVEWHAKTLQQTPAKGTPSLRLQAADMQQTLDNFEAFRIIAQRTQNLQVVDDKEINLHLTRARAATSTAQKFADINQRREKHIREAEALHRQAQSFSQPPEDVSEQSHVLGVVQQGKAAELPSAAPELPPWAIESDSGTPYNFTTRRFGDPTKGSYQELSDGKFRVLPRRDAQQEYDVDVKALPSSLRVPIEAAQTNLRMREEQLAAQREAKLQFPKYKKFDAFIKKAKEKQQQEKAADKQAGPLPQRRRMVHLLRKGHLEKALTPDEVAKFTMPL